ncbi:EXS-domain-containing protein [Paxillus ammoniavirescens]|nr:EXS-domain-containing protein [Paxillus ammoniavirescens]
MDVNDEVPLSASFPLPFRVLFLVGMGVLGWATNLHGLQLLGIDGPSTLELHANHIYLPLRSPSPSGSHPSARAFYTPVYRFFAGYVTWCFVAWLIFRMATHSDIALVDIFRYIPAVCVLGVLTILVCPYDVFHKRERDSFLFAAARCLLATSNSPVYFSDIIYADFLTSFAKVLGDMWLSLCMLLPGGSLLELPAEDGWHQWILPSLMSLPYLIRLRQCLIEYNSPRNSSSRPLFNAIKYASSLPVIFLSAAQRIVALDLAQANGHSVTREGWHGEHPLFRLWLLSAAINSIYSFWWDLTNDWGLDLLTSHSTESRGRLPRALVLPSLHSKATATSGPPQALYPPLDPASSASSATAFDATARHSVPYPYGLRSVLLYPLAVYPMAIFLNFVLRMTWSIKLSSHLHSQSEGSAPIFWLEIAEILRRWIWVFLRVEWEVVKRGGDKSRSMGNGAIPDDIELVPAHSKEGNVD